MVILFFLIYVYALGRYKINFYLCILPFSCVHEKITAVEGSLRRGIPAAQKLDSNYSFEIIGKK